MVDDEAVERRLLHDGVHKAVFSNSDIQLPLLSALPRCSHRPDPCPDPSCPIRHTPAPLVEVSPEPEVHTNLLKSLAARPPR